jgi:hypothetical protein
VSNVLDVPELFWTEASLGGLYESVREYMEVEERVGALNEKLGVASDFVRHSFFVLLVRPSFNLPLLGCVVGVDGSRC